MIGGKSHLRLIQIIPAFFYTQIILFQYNFIDKIKKEFQLYYH